MCNPAWTAWECFWSIYFVQLLLIALGVLLLLVGLLAKDPASTRLNQRPFLRIKDIEINLLLPKAIRLGFLYAGAISFVGGLIWLASDETQTPLVSRLSLTTSATATVRSAPTVSSSSLVSVSFMVDGWNPRLIDLRTAEDVGIPAWSGQTLKFSDLWVFSTEEPEAAKVQIEFYASGEKFIGYTNRVNVANRLTHLEKVKIEAFEDDNVSDAWKIQSDWSAITIVVIYFDKNDERIESNKTDVRLNPDSHSWLIGPPDVSFASIAYTVNDGQETWLDFHEALTQGLSLQVGDRIKITEIWYRAEDFSPDLLLGAEAYLTNDQFNEDTYINNPNNAIEANVHPLSNYTNPFEWEIKTGDTRLIMSLARSDGFVVDRLEIPIHSATAPE